MFSPKDRQNFLDILNKLRISTSYSALICVYKLLSKLISYCQDNAHQILTEGYTNRFCGVPGINWTFPEISHITDKLASPMLEDLCCIMYRYNMHEDYSRFFLVFAPDMAANWHVLRALDTKERPIIDVLYWHFVVTAEITNSEALFGYSYGDFYGQMHQRIPSLQPYEYELIWKAVAYHECVIPDMHSKRVTSAVNIYAAQGKSKQDLLEAYLLEQRDIKKTPICYADLSKQELQKVAIDKFPTDDDVNFHTAPRYVSTEWPDKVLVNLYDYSKEIPFEDSIVAFDAFLSRLHTASTPLIINPNPHILDMWLSLSKDYTELPQLSIAMPSRGIALALSRQYPQVHFFGLEELLPNPITPDLVLLYGTDTKKSQETKSKKHTKLATAPKLTDLFGCIKPTEKSIAIACINTQAITSKTPNMCELLSSKGLQISQMTIIPADKGLKGRLKKKSTVCVIAEPVPAVAQEIKIPLYSCMTTATRDYIAVLPDPMYIPLNSLNRGRSIPQILTEHIGTSTEKAGSRNSAKRLPWSREIVIRYSVYDGSTPQATYVRGKAYVQRMDASAPDNARKAIPMTQVEKGLRAKSEEDLAKKLAELPLREELYQPILDEVVRIYGNCPELLTIKTVWFCLRPLLMKKRHYEDDLAIQLFCEKNQALANLTFEDSYEEYCDALASVLENNTISLKHWRVLWQIADEAVEHGFIEKDPFSTFIPAIEATTRKNVYPIQEALRKWTFNDGEMDRMVQPMLERLPSGNARYEEDSHAFLKLFALFAPVRRAELCVLTVADIELLPNGGAQATITKYTDDNNVVQDYAQSGPTQRRRRKTALPPFLAACFKSRMNYMQKRFGWGNEAMKEMPLFFEIEPTYRAAKVKPCSMQTATRLFKELVDSANVPEDWIQLLDGEEMRNTNFGLGRKTENVFINNTRIQAAVYGLEDGEITYASGTEPEATIDSNYVGYNAPWNQIRTSAKMHRISAKFLGQIVPSVSAIPKRHTIRVSDVVYHQVVEPPVDQCLRLALDIFPELDIFDNPITLRIQSRFGHRTFATAFGGDDHD